MVSQVGMHSLIKSIYRPIKWARFSNSCLSTDWTANWNAASIWKLIQCIETIRLLPTIWCIIGATYRYEANEKTELIKWLAYTLFTGRETLFMYSRLRGVPEEHIEELSSKILKLLGIEIHAEKQVQGYSGGTKVSFLIRFGSDNFRFTVK